MVVEKRETSATGSNMIDVVLTILCMAESRSATPDPDIIGYNKYIYISVGRPLIG